MSFPTTHPELDPLPRPLHRKRQHQILQGQVRRLSARQYGFHDVRSPDVSSPWVGKLVGVRKWQNNRSPPHSQRVGELINTALGFWPSMLFLLTCESLCHAIV